MSAGSSSSSGGSSGAAASVHALDTAAAALQLPTLPGWISRRSRFLLTSLGLSCLAGLLVFICSNQDEIAVDCIVAEVRSTLAWWSLFCFFCGLAVSASVFWLRQGLLAAQVESHRAALSSAQAKHAELAAAYDKLRAAAANVSVPFSLAELVEKAGASPEQLSDMAYRSRQLHAGRNKYG